MTIIEAPALYERIEAPAVTPSRFGFFSVADFEGSGREVFHGTWESDACREVGVTESACVDVSTVPLTVNGECVVGTADPFTVYTYYDQSMSGSPLDWHESKARAQFALAEQNGVELAVGSALAAAAGAAFDASTLTAAYGQPVAELALAYVEGELGDVLGGVTGVIHTTRFVASLLGDQLVTVGGQLQTRLGTPVVAGNGYSTPLDALIVGSGPMATRRAGVEAYSAVDRSVNSASVVVERPYLIGWDCVPIAASLTAP